MKHRSRNVLIWNLFFMAVFFISMSGFSVQAQTIPFEGEGTKASPYLIQDADDMVSLSVLVNSGTSFSKQYLSMTNDIDLKGINFMPIGSGASNPFSGIFDGCNHKITNLSVTSSGQNCGLFGYIKNGQLYRMDVSGQVTCTYSGANSDVTVSVGLVAGHLYYTSIYGVNANGILTGPKGGIAYIGMVAGQIESVSRIRSGHASGTINMVFGSTYNNYYVGGVVGYSDYCYVENGDSSVKFDSNGNDGASTVGGIVGYADDRTEVSSCTLKGDIILNESAWKVGGIVGELGASSKVKNCLVEKEIDVTQTKYPAFVGGMVGFSNGSIDKCIYNGRIYTTIAYESYVGGILGKSGSVGQCVTSGLVHVKKAAGTSPTVHAGQLWGSFGSAGANRISTNAIVFIGETPSAYTAGTSNNWYTVFAASDFWNNFLNWNFDLDNVWGMETAGSPYLRNIIPASSVEILNGTEFTISKGGTVQLEAYISEPDTTEKCKYTSTKPEVARVNASTGLVTGVAEGTAYINVVTDGAGAKSTIVTINVVDNDISKASITLEEDSFVYNGSPIEPEVTVKMNDTTLVQGEDYKVAYMGNTGVGTATVTVTGMNTYTGTCSKTYTIGKGKSILSLDASYATEYTYSGSRLTAPYGEQIHCTNSEQTVTCKWYSGDVTTGTITASPLTSVTNAGVYTLVLTAVANTHYEAAECRILIRINPAEISEKLPSTIYVDYNTTKVPASLLAEYTGWSVAEKSVGIALEAGSPQTITAQYYDTDNYRNAVREVKVVRNAGTHTGGGSKVEWEEPACTESGHTWDAGRVTKEATETTEGVKTYRCKVCGKIRTEVIPKKASAESNKENVKPEKDEEVKDDKGTAMYEVADVSGKEVAYKAPADRNATKITVPSAVTINGTKYKVTDIADKAFSGCKKLTKVTIGKNIKTIGASAFSGCSKLKTVSMGANVTTIGDKAFYKCKVLTKISIPAKVSKIGKQAFYGCKKLKTINIKTTKLTSKKVGSKAFKGIYSKATIKVPKKKLTSYKKILKAKGVGSKAKIKK